MHVVSDESGSDDSDSDDILPDLGACSSDDDDDDEELASLATLGLLGGWLHLAGVPPASRRALTHLCRKNHPQLRKRRSLKNKRGKRWKLACDAQAKRGKP